MAFRKAKPAPSGGLLPGYDRLEEIGGGAFATVYRAVEAETGRPVALKILKVDTIHAHLIETFHQEIKALAQVSDHPNIVTLYRPSTTLDGRPVLVLELCQGSLASQVRASGPLGAVEVVRVGVKIAGALETAHRNGFLHRDMKPQNILVTNFGEPALADFGVAALQASAQVTAGVFGFTTLHAAPEMLEGHHLSPATDIYGLASTMYQLLTGQAPFATFDNEAPASVILRILRDPVRPLRAEHIPLRLADLLEAALSKQPEGRPRTALDFAHALQAVEQEQGWLVTDFIAWGQERLPADGRTPVQSSVHRPPPRRIDLTDGPGPSEPSSGQSPGDLATPRPLPGAPLYPTAPAVRVDAVEPLPGRSTLPPLLPSSEPPVPSPLPPPPPAPRRGPSVAIPEAGTRNVVAPAAAGRGQQPVQPAPPAQHPPAGHHAAEPPVSLLPPPSSAPPPDDRPGSLTGGVRDDAPPSPRPMFVDPPPLSSGPGTAELDSVYERTMEARRLFTTAPPAETPVSRSRPSGPVLAGVGLAVAAVVLIVAVLLLAGLL